MLRDCDAKLARYRAALDAGADPAVVTGWISQVQAERTAAEALLSGTNPGKSSRRMTAEEIATLVGQLDDILAVLAQADPADKAEVYHQLGLRLTWHHETQTAHAEIDPLRRWEKVRVRGSTRAIFQPRSLLSVELVVA